LIDTNDARIFSACYRNGKLWAAHSVFLPAGSTSHRCALQWEQLDTSGTVLQWGRIDDPSNQNFYVFPSIAANKNDDALIGFSVFSTSAYASAAYAYHDHRDPTGSLRAAAICNAGSSAYVKSRDSTGNRWGDISQTLVDPADDSSFWTTQEYAATPDVRGDRWGTWWAQVPVAAAAPPPPPPPPPPPAGSTLNLQGSRFQVTVAWQTSSSSGYGTAIPLTSDTGAFWFFTSSNYELLIKVLDACGGFNNFWVFGGGLTNVHTVITVYDSASGLTRTYTNPLNTAFLPIQDTAAFPCP
jgi:hypothetical protein